MSQVGYVQRNGTGICILLRIALRTIYYTYVNRSATLVNGNVTYLVVLFNVLGYFSSDPN